MPVPLALYPPELAARPVSVSVFMAALTHAHKVKTYIQFISALLPMNEAVMKLRPGRDVADFTKDSTLYC